VQRVLHLPACTALRLLVGRFAYVQPCGAAAGGCVEIAVAAGPRDRETIDSELQLLAAVRCQSASTVASHRAVKSTNWSMSA
jgi:hypothetical protein